ncbi:MAG: HU family DNA-binding protein, partial [Ignavibacteria bacterium]|nr:HU family DNA-binding protein [Ignavibacteria bacterium]
MNKAELIDAISAEARVSRADAERTLNATVNAISKALKKGD